METTPALQDRAGDAVGLGSGGPRAGVRAMLLVSAAVFGLLALWAWLFPYSGDGDAILHFLNAQVAARKPAEALYAWARPGYKIPLALFAAHGVYAARLFNAGITACCVWQTIRLAEDLRLPAALLAGPMMLFQASVFALGADTMTEIPLALGIAVAVRLWLARRWEWSGLVVGFLPLVRPEGFFLGLMWGVLVLFAGGPGRGWGRKVRVLLLMTVGLACWSAASWWLAGDWLRVVHAWSWPAVTYAAYPRGPFWYYPARWPEYCGLPVCVLFAIGAAAIVRGGWRQALTSGMALVAAVWLLIFLLHSVLFTAGWFCSSGVIRVLACSAPMTAVIGLRGWNELCDFLKLRRGRSPLSGVRGAAMAVAAIAAWAMGQFFLYGEHLDCFPIQRTGAYIRAEKLVGPATTFAAGNQILTAELGLQQDSPQVVVLPVDRDRCWRAMQSLPIGAILVWDNRQSEAWSRIDIEELQKAGFTLLHEERFYWGTARILGGGMYRYVVFRKDARMPDLITSRFSFGIY